MQPRKRVKKIQEYDLGDAVKDEGYYAGTVEAVMVDPQRASDAYMLVVTEDGHYTTYKGSTTVRCGLSLARRVPRVVAKSFAKVVLGGEPPDDDCPAKTPVPKSPVKKQPKEPVIDHSEDTASQEKKPAREEVSSAPYFDFV